MLLIYLLSLVNKFLIKKSDMSHMTIHCLNNKPCAFMEKIKYLASLCRKIWKIGHDDPRRAIHAFKVGFSLTLVSLLYLMEPLFKGVGQSAIWAVMTVVVVLEFTAGATLCKGLNRGFGTLVAASLAFLFELIARKYGKVFRAVFIGASIFLIGTSTTYLRFYPKIKKRYDYGVLVFLLTFNLITVSSYRVDDILKLAKARTFMIGIGSGICIVMSLFIFPNWSGEDLHNHTISKIEGLAKSIQACVTRYFEEPNLEKDEVMEDPIYENYKAVLDSKSIDETLAHHASWEPRYTWRCHKFPCQQYVKLGGVLRHFGYGVVALHGTLQTEIRTPRSVRLLFKEPCNHLALEVTKALMELAGSIRNRRHCSLELITNPLHQTLQDLDTALKSQPRLFLGPNSPYNTPKTLTTARQKFEHHLSNMNTDSPTLKSNGVSETEKRVLRPSLSKLAITSLEFSEALPIAAFVALLVELVARLDLVIEEVEELGKVACFKEFKHSGDVILDVDRGRTTEIYLPNSAVAE